MLAREELRLLQANEQIPIQCFAQEPASVGILVDTSYSMESKLQQAKAAITQFVNDLNPRDNIFLFAFSSAPFLLQPFTTNHDSVLQCLSLLYAQGQTALYDTLDDGMLMVSHGNNHQKALFVITDGYDNASDLHEQDVLKQAQRRHFPIYSIGIGSRSASYPGWFTRTFSRDNSHVDMDTLTELAKRTDAEAYNIPTFGNGEQLKTDLAAVAAAIGNRYLAGFTAKNAGGNSLRLEIRNHPGAIIKLEGAQVTVVNAANAAVSNATTH
jgi:VWFA-related protein